MEKMQEVHLMFQKETEVPIELSLSGNEDVTVSILTASLNEVDNLQAWFDQIFFLYRTYNLKILKEIVIVDDGSVDGTLDLIRYYSNISPIPIRLISRQQKSGTLNAQIIGANECRSEYVLVLDCDLQHPVTLIPDLLSKLHGSDHDIVIGSRYFEGGVNEWSAYRGAISRVATFISHVMLNKTRKVKDPLSGFFIIKRSMLSSLVPHIGMYKPLLYAISMFQDAKIVETPVTMLERKEGESKIVTRPFKMILGYFREVLTFWINSNKGRAIRRRIR